MVSRRSALITIGAALPLTGCTSTSDTDEEGENNSSEPNSEADSNRTNDQTNSTKESAEISIVNVATPESITKGSDFEITTTINTDTNVTLSAEVIDKNDNIIAEDSTHINQTGEQVITLSPSREAALGNGSIQVQATDGSVIERSSSRVTVTADWQEAFINAKDNLEQFLSEFAAVSPIDEPTILDTTISTDYTNEGRSLLTEAEDLSFEALEGVPDSNNSFRNKIQRLRSEVGAARKMSTLQGQVFNVFSNNQDRLDSDSYPRVELNQLDEQESQQSEFAVTVSDLNPVVGSRYEKKAEQFESELESMDNILAATREVSTAQDALDDDRYDTAFTSAKEAKSMFETVIENTNKPEAYPPIDRIDESFVDHVKEWKSAANEIQLSAAAEQGSE